MRRFLTGGIMNYQDLKSLVKAAKLTGDSIRAAKLAATLPGPIFINVSLLTVIFPTSALAKVTGRNAL